MAHIESSNYNKLFTIAAIFEGDFSIDWIHEITKEKPSQILTAIEAGIERGLLEKSGQGNFKFKNIKKRKQFESNLDPKEKKRLCRLIIEILMQEAVDENSIALHVAPLLLTIPNDIKQCHWLLKAGNLYRKAYDYQKATQCYRHIIQELRNEHGQAADNLFIEAAVRYSRLVTSERSDQDVLTVLMKAIERAEKVNNQAGLALLEMEMASNDWFHNRYAEAFKHFERARSITESIDDEKITRSFTTATTFFHMWEGRYRDVVQNYEKVRPVVEKYPHGRFALQSALTLGVSYAYCGQINQGLGLLDAIRKHCLQAGDIHTASTAGQIIGWVFLEIGKTDDAIQCFNEVLKQTIKDNQWVRINAMLQLSLAYYRINQNEKAVRHLKDFMQLKKKTGRVMVYPTTLEFCWAIACKKLPRIEGLSLEKEINRSIRSRNIVVKGIGYRYQSLLYKEMGQPHRKIIQSLLLSRKWLELSGYQVELAKTQIELARMYLLAKDEKKAGKTVHKAAKILYPINESLIPDDLRPLLNNISSSENILKEILRLGQELPGIRNNNELVVHIISTANRIAGAERGAIFQQNQQDHSSQIVLRAAENLTVSDISLPSFNSSMQIIKNTIKTGKGQIHVLDSEAVENGIPGNTVRSCICVPMKLRGQVVGVLYHDNRLLSSKFKESDFEILEYFSMHAAIALDNAEAYEEIKELNQRLKEENLYYEQQQLEHLHFENIVGRSKVLLRVLDEIQRVAKTDTTVLILGETGVGKELLARAIYNNSPRCDKPFIRVNCSAFTPTLISSELFGHEKGAFTGAANTRMGRFELADGGTLFLDEIADIPHDVQVRLLRVLQSREFERIGGGETLTSDFRLVTATNRDLKKLVKEGKFREDLYFRLNGFPIHVPPLRERKEDIPLLAYYFLKIYASKLGKELKKISSSIMDKLLNYDWPGNIRELEHVIERSIVLSNRNRFRLPEEISVSLKKIDDMEQAVSLNLKKIERKAILSALRRSKGKISGPSGAAELLDIHPNTMYTKMKKLGIKKDKVLLNGH